MHIDDVKQQILSMQAALPPLLAELSVNLGGGVVFEWDLNNEIGTLKANGVEIPMGYDILQALRSMLNVDLSA